MEGCQQAPGVICRGRGSPAPPEVKRATVRSAAERPLDSRTTSGPFLHAVKLATVRRSHRHRCRLSAPPADLQRCSLSPRRTGSGPRPERARRCPAKSPSGPRPVYHDALPDSRNARLELANGSCAEARCATETGAEWLGADFHNVGTRHRPPGGCGNA